MKISEKRIVSIIMCAAFFLSMITPIEAFGGTTIGTASAITAETNVSCSISSSGESQYYSFTPSASAYYVFTSWGTNVDPMGSICDSSGSVIETDDDSGEGRNFKLVYYLEAQKKYYFSARCYSDATGSFTVRMSKYDEIAPDVSASTTSDLSSTQIINLSITDDNGIAFIYFGTNDEFSDNYPNSYNNRTSISTKGTASKAGTYYVDVFDGSYNRTTYSFTYELVTLYPGYSSYSTVLIPYDSTIELPEQSDNGDNVFFGWIDANSYEEYTGISSVEFVDSIEGGECYPEYYGIWGTGAKYTASVSEGSRDSYYFTPSETGVYEICSISSYDTVASLYENDNYLCGDDDSGYDSNFRMIRYLTSGKTYEIYSGLYSDEMSGSYKVGINKITCDHTEISESLVKATFSSSGKIKETCAVCGKNIRTENIPALKKSNVFLSSKKLTYTGKSIKPEVVVFDSKDNYIWDDNYSVTYKNSKNIGTASATVTFKNNYKGSITLNYTIAPKSVSITNKQLSLQKKNKLKISLPRVSSISGYQIYIGEDQNYSKKTSKTVKSSTKSITYKIKYNKPYYIKVRTYKTVSGKKYYSDWSKTRKIRIY